MNEFLADIYGTGASMEKQASSEFDAKFEEADFLGRVMAHAYTQEMNKIAGDYKADAKTRPPKTGFTKAEIEEDRVHRNAGTGGLKGPARESASALEHAPKHTSEMSFGEKAEHYAGKAHGAVGDLGGKILGRRGYGYARRAFGGAARHVAGYGALGAGAAAAGAGAYGIHKAMSKKSSVQMVEDEAQKRAASYLLENGVNPFTLEYLGSEEEKVACAMQLEGVDFESAANERAIEMLADLGIEV